MHNAGSLPAVGLIFALASSHTATAGQADRSNCRIVREGDAVEISSPFFAYRLTTGSGLRAEAWENRLTGRKVSLGNGPELEVDIGLPSGAVTTVQWLPSATQLKSDTAGEAIFELRAEEPKLAATVRYVWDADRPVLRKFVEIRNDGNRELNRLLNVRLGEYGPSAGATLVTAGRGFPAYIADEFFLSLAHPAGFADVKDGKVVLRQYPGTLLTAGQKFQCMEAVYGVAPSGGGRDSFIHYVRSRMRRVLRGHDKPYAILESFGGQPSGDFWVTEAYVLEHLAKVAQGLREGAPPFDFYCTEFWHDAGGDLTTFHPKCFPNGYQRMRDEILKLGMRPGLWIDSGGLPQWTIADNPAIRGCFTKGDGKGEICRASEPINTLYKKAFIHHVRENKVGLLKFDNMGPSCQQPCCDNPAHAHLPGPLYSVEAIHNAIIDFFRELDTACPDVFIVLYWGYRGPWWLEYGDIQFDTYFASGTHIEAASPTEFPTAYARDSVTQRLDQAHFRMLDTPWLGKDSLGIWLSDWPWNSCIGKARWQEGLIMDLCRGNLLAQIWTDTNWLTPAERRQLADFVALLKANPDCFGNSRFILGNPWKSEPYGYSCSNGKRAFLAIHNACLEDRVVTLPLGAACGLPDKGSWDIYRWYPKPGRLKWTQSSAGVDKQIALRPFEVVLLEVVPNREGPSLKRAFDEAPMATAFAEPSRRLDMQVSLEAKETDSSRQWHALKPALASAGKARLTVRDDDSVLAGGDNADGDVYTVTAHTDLRSLTAVMIEALTDDSLPSHGPGRAENGNFALTGFRVLAAPSEQPDKAKEIRFRAATADYSQTSHGGWPVAAAIDSSTSSGWSIHPEVGSSHAAVFEFEKPIDLTGATVLTFKLVQGERGHSLGRFRLSVSTAESPSLPASYMPSELVATAELSASRSDRLLLFVGDRAMEAPRAVLSGQSLRIEPVWSDKAFYACPWRAWRAEIGPDQSIRRLDVRTEMRRTQPAPQFEAYVLPK